MGGQRGVIYEVLEFLKESINILRGAFYENYIY